MKVVIKKRAVSQAPAPAKTGPARQAPQVQMPSRSTDSGAGKTVAIWIAVAVLAVMAFGGIHWKMSRKAPVPAARRAPAPAGRSAAGRGALDGVDLKAWCLEHEKDNLELQNRRARRTGAPPPSAGQP